VLFGPVLAAARRARLEITTGEPGIGLRLTYPATRSWPAPATAALGEALTALDAAAQRWGHHGHAHGGAVWHTVWAVLAPAPGSPTAAPPASATGSGQPVSSRDDPQAGRPPIRRTGPVGSSAAPLAAARPP
jgi:hypothetical protein